ncbi:MAG: hypothetical protein QXP59_03975 [Saccharolobus sp.]
METTQYIEKITEGKEFLENKIRKEFEEKFPDKIKRMKKIAKQITNSSELYFKEPKLEIQTSFTNFPKVGEAYIFDKNKNKYCSFKYRLILPKDWYKQYDAHWSEINVKIEIYDANFHNF